VQVVVADGFLQIRMPNSVKAEDCSDSKTIAVPDKHKYFDAYLALAMTVLVSGRKLNVAVGIPCQHSVNWPLIHVMMIQN
jgi:hypothetical protein